MTSLPIQFEELTDLVWALANNQLDDAGTTRLQELLSTNPDNRRVYIELMDQFALLEWERGEAKTDNSQWSENSKSQIPNQLTQGAPPLVPDPASPVSIILDATSPLNSLPSPLYVAHPCLFSNLFAILVVSLGTLGAWLYQTDIPQPIARDERPRVSPIVLPSADQLRFVGRVTGMLDVQWSDNQTATVNGANVSLGRKYALASGLMQITYDTGANVILQGPCIYEVDSRDSGFLSVGKLTAQLDNAKPQAVSQKSSLSTIHYPLFTIKTPTTVVTDLGTEFGVEVDKKGATASHVFRGSVEVRLIAANGKMEKKGQILRADESALVDVEKRTISTMRDTNIMSAFVRKMPLRVPIRVFNTGKGLKEGEPDLHWEIIRASNDPKFKPRQAVVASVPEGCWGPNEPLRSQWISTEGKHPLAMGGMYTFRTTFDLTGKSPKTAVLRGWFLVDDCMQSMRINGREVSLKETGCGPVPYSLYRRFTIDQGFVEGVNILEIEVNNSEADDKTKPNPMGLRIELSGYANQLEEGEEGGS